jgi:DMSO/TMAO reductase YedYZ molybdopterin-dependent catalytic subunit
MRTLNRRHFVSGTAATGAVVGAGGLPLLSSARAARPELASALPEGVHTSAILDALPGKKTLIKLSYRPPNYETPIEYFREAITPNDAFFVRYHLAVIPEIDAKTWKLSVGGDGANGEAQLTLDDLKKMPPAEVVAVNQCSGNRRGLFQPHVPGVEWGYGAMGCARWKGARLKDVLDKVGVKKVAVEIQFDGADRPVVDKTPDFVKSIPVWKAVEDTTLIAYEMNGEALPHFNGFPVRLIVPGWTGTYWMKHLVTIKALTQPDSGFWMKAAYRIPLGKFPLVARFTSQDTAVNTPITEMMVNSLITSHGDGAQAKAGSQLSGLAWDGGYGIRSVDVSLADGRSWTEATLGEDLGRFAFRPWKYGFAPRVRGKLVVKARATNQIGQTQTTQLIANPAGYHHNLIQSLTLNAA